MEAERVSREWRRLRAEQEGISGFTAIQPFNGFQMSGITDGNSCDGWMRVSECVRACMSVSTCVCVFDPSL